MVELIGPSLVHWRDGMRRMVEERVGAVAG
jgi:hypothetical protein